jgi:hypothetical protein
MRLGQFVETMRASSWRSEQPEGAETSFRRVDAARSRAGELFRELARSRLWDLQSRRVVTRPDDEVATATVRSLHAPPRPRRAPADPPRVLRLALRPTRSCTARRRRLRPAMRRTQRREGENAPRGPRRMVVVTPGSSWSRESRTAQSQRCGGNARLHAANRCLPRGSVSCLRPTSDRHRDRAATRTSHQAQRAH